jgi:hypothetical protein
MGDDEDASVRRRRPRRPRARCRRRTSPPRRPASPGRQYVYEIEARFRRRDVGSHFRDGGDSGPPAARRSPRRRPGDLVVEIEFKVVAARVIGQEWRATRIVGTLDQSEPVQPGCTSSSASHSLRARLVR